MAVYHYLPVREGSKRHLSCALISSELGSAPSCNIDGRHLWTKPAPLLANHAPPTKIVHMSIWVLKIQGKNIKKTMNTHIVNPMECAIRIERWADFREEDRSWETLVRDEVVALFAIGFDELFTSLTFEEHAGKIPLLRFRSSRSAASSLSDAIFNTTQRTAIKTHDCRGQKN